MQQTVDGEGVLFIHGAGSRGLLWYLQLLAFPRAQAPDLPGRTNGTARPLDVDGYLEVLRAGLGPGRQCIVGGHSLGGAIALRWALNFPDEVRALILIGTGARLRVAPRFLDGVRAGDRETVEEFGAMWFAPQTPARLREKSLLLLRTTPPAVLLGDLSAADGFDVMDDINRLLLPTLIVCGTEDRLTPVKHSQYLHDHIWGSELVLVEGAGHMPMIEQPQATNAAIRVFLERLERGRDARPDDRRDQGAPG